MAAELITDINSAMKVVFTPQQLKKIMYDNQKLFALLKKKVFPGGKYLPLPVQFGNPQGRSRTFGTAQANVGASKVVDFQITLVKDYGVVLFDGMDMKLANGGESSFIDMKSDEIANQIDQVRRNLCISLYGAGTGQIGTVTAISSLAISVATDAEIRRFEVGMPVSFLDSTGGSAANTTVTAVNTNGKVFSVASATGIVNGDYIYCQGDKDLSIKGLAAWIPAVAPTTGDSFFSVDRSVNASRLAGHIIDGTAMPIHEALLEGLRKVGEDYGRPDVVIVPFSKFVELEKVLMPNCQFDLVKAADAVLGIRSIQITGPNGPVNIIPDSDCPSNRSYVLTMDTWCLYHLNNAPIIIDEEDGNMILRSASADSFETRIKSYANLACNAPGKNGVILL